MIKDNRQNLTANPSGNVPLGILLSPLKRAYRLHLYRYNAWDQAGYRVLVVTFFSITVLSLLGLALWLGRAGYLSHMGAIHRAQARAFLEHGDYPNALRTADLALALNPSDARACRIRAEVAVATHQPAELTWCARLVELAPTLENKLFFAEAGLQSQNAPYPLTTRILGEAAPGAATNAEFHELSAQLSLALSDPEIAHNHFAEACQLAPANSEYALNYALFRLGRAHREEKALIRAEVEKLGLKGDNKAAAWRALVADSLADGNAEAALSYSKNVLATSQADLADRLQNLEILQRLHSASFATSLLPAEAEAETNPESVAEMSDWMRTHGLLTQNVEWLVQLPNGTLGGRPLVQVALGKAYLQSNNWKALLDFGSHGDWEDMDFLRLAMISHAWSQLGMATLAASNWTEAVRKANDHDAAMTSLLDLAKQWHLKEEEDDLRPRVRQSAPFSSISSKDLTMDNRPPP